MQSSRFAGLKALKAKIHPPLPLTPRESQKLLAQLTGSFQNHLDQEHPQSSSAVRSKPIDAHIHAVLTSPLLHKSSSTRIDGPTGAESVSGLSEAQSLLNDPMGHFKTQVAAGQATVDAATCCLKAHHINLQTLGAQSTYGSASPNIRPAAAVLQWLWSSGLEESLEFTHDKQFLAALTPFLVAEDKVGRIWSWFSRLQKIVTTASHTAAKDTAKAMGNTLACLLRARMVNQDNIDDALNDYLQAVEGLNVTNTGVLEQILQPSCAMISRKLLRNPSVTFTGSLYNELLASIHLWRVPGHNLQIEARLALFGPNPDAGLALLFFQASKYHKTMKSTSFEYLMCLQTIRVLSEQKNETAVQWMEEFLQQSDALKRAVARKRRGSDSRKVAEYESLHGLAWT